MRTEPFCAGSMDKASVLVIGHDPRLQESDTQAEFAFFADYFFRPRPSRGNEVAKFGFAKATFDCISVLTSNRYPPDQLVFTNLCNAGLPHAPAGKTVLIPARAAQAGIDAICRLLDQSPIKIVFAMSQQVNYWLQKLGFSQPVAEFLRRAEPKPVGLNHNPPYYEAMQGKSFQLICGQVYSAGGRIVVPILHTRHWPLRGAFVKAYSHAYEDCQRRLHGLGIDESSDPPTPHANRR